MSAMHSVPSSASSEYFKVCVCMQAALPNRAMRIPRSRPPLLCRRMNKIIQTKLIYFKRLYYYQSTANKLNIQKITIKMAGVASLTHRDINIRVGRLETHRSHLHCTPHRSRTQPPTRLCRPRSSNDCGDRPQVKGIILCKCGASRTNAGCMQRVMEGHYQSNGRLLVHSGISTRSLQMVSSSVPFDFG